MRTEAAAYVRLSLSQFDRERKKGKYQPTGWSSARRPLWDRYQLDRELGAMNDDAAAVPIMALIDAD